MKKYFSSNSELNEILAGNGITLTCNDHMDIIVSDEDAARIPAIVDEFAPAAAGDYALEQVSYSVYYKDNCDCFHFDNKVFGTLEEAKEFCGNYVKDDQPYDVTDSPDTNNHYCLEVYSGNPAEDEPDYRTGEYHKN